MASYLAFRFSEDAQQLFNAFLTDLETAKLRADLHSALVGHLPKYCRLMPSLALLFELVDGGAETVSLQHARQAAVVRVHFLWHSGAAQCLNLGRQDACETSRSIDFQRDLYALTRRKRISWWV